MTVTGGTECSFVAALARWLLDLSVTVEDEGGSIIFTSVLNRDDAQLRVRYSSNRGANPELQVVGTGYVLGDFRDMLSHAHPSSFNLVARIPWDVCLSHAFGGASLSQLLSAPEQLGLYLGSVARIYEALAHSEPDVLELNRITYIHFHPANHGRGFIHCLLQTFPELECAQNLRDSLYKAVAIKSVKEAVQEVDKVIRTWVAICRCAECSPNGPDSNLSERYCMLAIACTIRVIALNLGSTIRDPHLYPTNTGLAKVYKYKYSSLRGLRKGFTTNVLDPDLTEALLGPKLLEPARDCWPGSLSELFICPRNTVLQTELTTYDMKRSALCRGGICIYLNALCSPSSQAQSMGIIHIQPGHV